MRRANGGHNVLWPDLAAGERGMQSSIGRERTLTTTPRKSSSNQYRGTDRPFGAG